LEVVIEEYSKENKRAGNWSKRTMIEYRSIFNNILKLIGNVPVNTIDQQSALDFKQTLMSVPADYFKATKKYEKIPLSEAIKSKPKKTLTAKTVNKYITNLSAILNYACNHGYTETNYASNIKIRLKGKASKERDQFSNEDLTALFHSIEYIEDTFDVPWKFWLPVLGLFTGCRMEELCQLTLSDIKQEHGIWVLDVKEDSESDKKTKTESSNRLVPLHPFITQALNFIGDIEHLKTKGETRLFPELKKQSERYGHYPSRWFGDYKKKCGIISDPGKKVFHSLRHNLQDNLKQKLVFSEIIDELVGHAHEGQTLGRYTEQYQNQTLFEKGILKLDYGIDLSHLKKSKYVPKKLV
jgi:integrase